MFDTLTFSQQHSNNNNNFVDTEVNYKMRSGSIKLKKIKSIEKIKELAAKGKYFRI